MEPAFYRTEVHYEFRSRCLEVVCKKSVLKNLRKSTYWIYYIIICLLYIKLNKNQVSCRVCITFDSKTLFQHLIRTVNVRGGWVGGGGQRVPALPLSPLPPSPTILAFFVEKSDKKWHRNESVQPKMWCPSRKFFYELYSVTQSFLLVFIWSSDKITVSNKKKTHPRAYQSI